MSNRSRLALTILSFIASLFDSGAPAAAVTVGTTDGLSVAFSDLSGAVEAVTVNGANVSLVPGQPGGLSLEIGSRIAPASVVAYDFDSGVGAINSARNAAWDNYGSYVSWLADGGPDGSGHVLLGDGVTAGAGMAMTGAVSVPAGGALRIRWNARAASVETTQILCVRIYDAQGTDITPVSSAPSSWGWSSTSQAHYATGFTPAAPDVWELFEKVYSVPQEAASARVSLRYWTGGDPLIHVDDFRLDIVGGVAWDGPIPIASPLSPIAGGFMQSAAVPGYDVQVETTVVAEAGHIRVHIALQDTASMLSDLPIVCRWTMPVAAAGWRWWDDIDVWREIAPGTVLRNTFYNSSHAISCYPLSAVTGANAGLSLAVPMGAPAAQRFECDAAVGLRSIWEIGLSPLTTKLGAGHAEVSMVLYHHDPAWGFRAAADQYYAIYPDAFVKRTTREGAWMYPIHPSQIPDVQDFGFAFHETWPLDEAERALCAQYDIGVYYYVEPWYAWQGWGNLPEKPPYEERVEKLGTWATGESELWTWVAGGGVDGSAHLLLGDGFVTGAGIALVEAFAVQGGQQVAIAWDARVADLATTQILCVRVFDALGEDITYASGAPSGWGWSSGSAAHYVAGIVASTPDTWEHFTYAYVLPVRAASMRISLRYWNGGDGRVHIDNLEATAVPPPVTYVQMYFETADGSWISAYNADWEDGSPKWLRAPRNEAAQAVMNASPLDADGQYFIDASAYFWHEWAKDSWNQAWPINADPDLPSPNMFDLYRDYWIHAYWDEIDGMYIDSVSATGSWANVENRRAEHLAVTDSPLTFVWGDGGASQLAPQAHVEFLDPIAQELRDQGKWVMQNLFATGMRFHAQNADIMGSEVFLLVEGDANSRLRRTLARHRIVSNLLQWGWDQPTYATSEQMEEFIRGQLFWGFYPAVSSAGGMLSGGTPDRYFLHPELYERDRPLFVKYIPVIQQLSTAGWEPVTYATAGPDVDIERFGSLSAGTMLLTVRGTDGAAADTTVTVDLTGCGLNSNMFPIRAHDVLAGVPLAVQRLSNPPQAQFTVSLAAGEVGVYAFEVPSADLDDDGDVDLADFHGFAFCFNGPNRSMPTPSCAITDFDDDGDVDLSDFSVFQQCFNGPNRPPACP